MKHVLSAATVFLTCVSVCAAEPICPTEICKRGSSWVSYHNHSPLNPTLLNLAPLNKKSGCLTLTVVILNAQPGLGYTPGTTCYYENMLSNDPGVTLQYIGPPGTLPAPGYESQFTPLLKNSWICNIQTSTPPPNNICVFFHG